MLISSIVSTSVFKGAILGYSVIETIKIIKLLKTKNIYYLL